MDISKQWEHRFNKKWELNQVNGCWEWKGAFYSNGYGQIKVPKTRTQIGAHRLSYLIHKGAVQEGKYVLHKCDNRKCVNPDHLFIGSKKDNSQDMVAKKRHCFGERQGAHKLTEANARKILEYVRLGITQSHIAQAFQISPMQVSRIKRGLRWAHLKD